MTTRPTSDRVREAVFSTLAARTGHRPVSHVLDLFAGSGALGLEALSRGADSVVFVEFDRGVVRTLRDNIAQVGLPGASVITADVRSVATGTPEKWNQTQDRVPIDCLLCDPPYALGSERIGDLLAGLATHGWLASTCEVVVERDARDPASPWPTQGVQILDEDRRTYGDTALWYGRLVASAPEGSRGES